MHKTIFHQMMKNTITKIINDFTLATDFVLTVSTNQIFSNHTYQTNKYDNVELIHHLTTIIFRNHYETRINRKVKATIYKQHPNYYFTDKQYQRL